jgi:hypothetical protein
MSADLRDILHTPYKLGGRTVGVELDCLGVVGELARRRGWPPPDGWPSIRDAWESGVIDAASGFPAGWRRQPKDAALADGDVLVFIHRGRQGCAMVHRGYIASAAPVIGCYFLPIDRWEIEPAEVWRWQP